MSVTIYHNPRCSKSRQTLELLKENGVEPKVIEYLNETPTVEELQGLSKKLKKRPQEFVRVKEDIYKELNLAGVSDNVLLKAMSEHPKLIERPIVVKGEQAVIGRPPENVLELLS